MGFIDNLINGFKGGQKQAQTPQVATAVTNAQPVTQAQLDAFRSAIKPADYTTQLNPDEQTAFNSWVADMRSKGAIHPNDNFQDYDMQGYWKNEVLNNTNLAGGNAQAHFTDKYKMPNHATFSNESMYYNTANSPYAGSWQGENFISPVGDPQAEQAKNNAILNALGKMSPSNWDDATRQRVLMTSKFLSGFGGTQYDNNQNLFNNIARGVANGSNEAYKQIQNYNNYQQAKNMYDQMGLDSSTLNPLADYSSLTADKLINLGIQQRKQQTARDIAGAKDNTARLKLIMDGLKNNNISTEEAERLIKIYGIDIQGINKSNQTTKTEAQVEKIKKETEFVGKPKVTVNVRQGGTKSTVEHKHTGGSGGSSKPKLLY